MKEHWKVGEVAELAGLTIRTLRYYDQICLFSPSQYTESGHRLYTQADLVRLQPILSLKQMGMSLEEIQLLLSNPEEQTVAEILQIQISRVKKEIEVQQKLVADFPMFRNAASSRFKINQEMPAKLSPRRSIFGADTGMTARGTFALDAKFCR